MGYYPGLSHGPGIITGAIRRVRQEGQSQRRCDHRGRGQSAARPLAKEASRSWERQGNGFSSRPLPEGMQPCQNIDFSPAKLTLDI